MKRSPEDLEKLIHATLRSAADYRAPRSLESRVLAAVAAKAARPWWQQSFAQWPVGARIAFVLFSAGIAKLVLMATVWAFTGFDGAQFASAFSTQFAWMESAASTLEQIRDLAGSVVRSIPTLWWYGGLAFLATMYLTLFGLGAAAYRTLIAQR